MELQVGDVIEQQYGPFVSDWRVVEVTDVGARLMYLSGTVEFIGYQRPIVAPGGKHLTTDLQQEFLGRAHWHSAKVVSKA